MMEFDRNEFNFLRSVENNNRRAVKSGAVANLTLEQFENAYIYFGGKCAYSGRKFSPGDGVTIEHIIPIISGGHSMAFNCIPVMLRYNSSKSRYHLLDWWKCQNDGFGNTIYNPYRLLKILNYMIKSLEAINQDDEMYVLRDNEIDIFLAQNQDKLEVKTKQKPGKYDYQQISQLEVFAKLDMLTIEDLSANYSIADKLKLNTAIFFEETLYELRGQIPENILHMLEAKINALPKIYIDDKKVFKNEMDEQDILIRRTILEWAESENLDNKYGIVGYMDFEVLKQQPDVLAFLDNKKKAILDLIGASSEKFNSIINKVPDILTHPNIEERIDTLATVFNISRERKGKDSSELCKYIINKPDLILSGENMDILLKYAKDFHIDKRLLKKGIPISTIIDNIEISLDMVDKADLHINDEVKKRVFEKLINNTTGSLLRGAYRTFKKMVKSENENLSKEEIARDASRWIICISEKYNSSEILKTRRIDKTRNLYGNMRFNEEGHLVGVNPNAYIVPKIIAMAELNISREAESEILNNVFFVKRIRQGDRADRILRDLAQEIKKDSPESSDEEVMKEASSWFVFLSECSDVPLDELFNQKKKDRYIQATKPYYKKMAFDGNGNFIDQNIPELKDLVIGVDYKKIVDSYFNSTGSSYIIRGRYVPKSEVQGAIYAAISKCKNKKAVKATCIKILKELGKKVEKEGGGPGGEER